MRFALCFIVLFGCGHDEHAEHPEHREHEEHEEHEEHGEHEHMSPALQGFHDVLAPVWHSDPGAVRAGRACDASTPMVDKVAATNDPALISAVSELAKACMSPDKSQVEALLTKVHERFHALIEH
jgi:hypothetical protein